MNQSILAILIAHKDEYISGEDIASQLNISRAYVWKVIKSYQKQGILIDSKTKVGYRLIGLGDKISEVAIKSYLTPGLIDSITLFDTIDSTNNYAKQYVTQTQDHTSLIISNEQTQGRGRMGKSFYSPTQTGIYMTLAIKKPNFTLEETQLLTICTALAVTQALKKLFNLSLSIKWLNDIYYTSKKLAGILIEGSFEIDSHSYQDLIIGIGINTKTQKDIPADIEGLYIALDECLNDNTIDRNLIIAEIWNSFFRYIKLQKTDPNHIIQEYKDLSLIFDKSFTSASKPNQVFQAIDILANGNLLAKNQDGEEVCFQFGDISIIW